MTGTARSCSLAYTHQQLFRAQVSTTNLIIVYKQQYAITFYHITTTDILTSLLYYALSVQKKICSYKIVHISTVCAGAPVVGSPVFSLLTDVTTHSPHFTITCPSSTFPPLSTAWFRDGQSLAPDGQQFQVSQVLVDPAASGYDNVLSVSGNLPGQYRCVVRNNVSSSEASLEVRGESGEL